MSRARSDATERPGENAARVVIEHHGEIAPAIGEPEVGDVAHPDAIDPGDARLPDTIGMLGKARANAGLRAIAADGFGAESRFTEEARHAAAATAPARRDELLVETRTAIAIVVAREAPHDLRGQRPVLARVRTERAPAPRVESGARDVVAAAEWSDAEAFVLRDEVRDEGEAVAFRALQNRMAFFKRSCSSFSSAYCRSRRCSCAISRAGPAGGAFRGWPRSRPSFTSFRHFESMKG